MRFNLRTLLAWTAIIAIVLTIFRRPINWLWDNGTQSTLVQAFLNSFRHFAWLAGYDVEYFGGSDTFGTFTPGEGLAGALGCIVSLFVHIALLILLGGLIHGLLLWAKPRPGDDH